METLSEYQKICRICLKNELLVSIYNSTFPIPPIEMLEKLNILKLPLDDSLPPLLCQSCLYRLLDAFNLQQLADASERLLREYIGLPTSSSPATRILNSTDLPNSDLIKQDTNCSSVSMYSNICDMFDCHDVKNDMVEVVGTDDVELLNDVEIDVSNLTRSEAEDASLNNAFMTTEEKISFGTHFMAKNLQNFEMQEQDFEPAFNQDCIGRKVSVAMKSQRNTRKVLRKPLKNPDKCSECGKVFHYKGYLKIHKRVHSGEKPFKCVTCSREFTTSTKLSIHQRTHNTASGKRFQCEICSAFLTTSSNLKAHKLTHINKREYQCTHCSVAFKSPRDLKRHETSHKTIKDIKCMLCEKSFTKQSSLKAHTITVHHGIRKHKCIECDKTFAKRSNLIGHMTTHSGEKKFECVYCSWKYAQSSSLRRHMKKHMRS